MLNYRIRTGLLGLVFVAATACVAQPPPQSAAPHSASSTMAITTPAIIIDQIVLHDDSNVQNNTVPPGVDGLQWCHLVSTTDFEAIEAFLDANPSIGQPSANIRRPIDGSFVTYAGLTPAQRDEALLAGASPQRVPFTFTHAFDYLGQDPAPATYEP